MRARRRAAAEGTGNYLEQEVSGLTAGNSYSMKFFCTHRRDAAGLNWGGAFEELQVFVDGNEVWASAHPPDDFEEQITVFTASGSTGAYRVPPASASALRRRHLRAEGLGLELDLFVAAATIRFYNNSPVSRGAIRPVSVSSSFASQGFCCAQGGDNSVFIDFVRITAMAIKGVIEIPNPSFEENPEVASCAWTLSPLPQALPHSCCHT